MSHYKKQADGRYRSTVKIGRDSQGAPVVKYASGRTIRELEANIAEMRRTHIAGGIQLRHETLFSTFAWEWYHAYKEPYVSVGAQQNYESIFSVHVLPSLGHKQIGAITAADLQALLASLWEVPYACGVVRQHLRQLFRFAVAHRYIEYDPTASLKVSPHPRSTRRALTAAETAAALQVGREHPDGLLLVLLYYLGLRRGEALGLKWGDLDLRNSLANVSRDIDFRARSAEGDLKTTSAYRTIPIPGELLEALRPLAGLPQAPVCQAPCGKWSAGVYARLWTRLMEALYAVDPGIEYEGEPRRSILTAHYFRHNYASLLYNADVDVLSAKKWLGHSNVSTTLGIYSHLGADKEDRNILKLKQAFF